MLAALGLASATGATARGACSPRSARLEGAPGRMERVARIRAALPVFVDYAHTPDALETALTALRPHAAGRLVVRVRLRRRPRPRQAAADGRDRRSALADRVIVTDDNPRSEDPAGSARAILAACPGASEIGDRGEAIRAGRRAGSAPGDVLLIAGKGHETGQIVGDRDAAVRRRRGRARGRRGAGG